jgi:large subunit ribosomal protein L25
MASSQSGTSSTQKENFKLEIFAREKKGKSAAFQLRRKERVPAVVYGPNLKEGITVAVSPKDVRRIYLSAGKTGLVTLETKEGAPSQLNGTQVLFKELQGHPLKNTLLHVDLHQLDLKRPIRVTVPLNFVGKAKGLAEGGIMSIVSRQVEIKCLPTEIPNHIDVDVSELGVNDSIHVEELSKKYKDSKLQFIFEANVALVAIVPPEEEKAAAPVAADAAAATAGGAAASGAPAAGAPAAGAAPAAAAGAPAKAAPAKDGGKKA